MGYDKDGVIYTRLDSEEDYNAYSNLIRQNPDVIHLAGSDHQILSSLYSDPVKYQESERESLMMDVGDNYFTTMGMEIIEGRDFQLDSENDRLESIIVNETFLKELSISDALGARVVMRDTVQLFIVGVVKDFYISGFWDPIEPMMVRYTAKENFHHLIVSTKPENLVALYEQMRLDWKEVFPNKLYKAEYLEEELAEAAEVNGNILIMFVILGLVATILSATGLYTMVSLNIIKRMKEIGVRKVLGASIGHIIRVVNIQFVFMLSISAVLGSVAGYYMADMLMGSIWAYYQGVNIMAILISVGLMFFISGAAISFKVYKASSTNPVNTLRVE